jgi:hypothetical protein
MSVLNTPPSRARTITLWINREFALALKKVANSPSPPTSQNSYDQRLHDLRAIYANFKTVMELLRTGYRFDDADAPAAMNQLTKALGLLEVEIRTLEAEWKADR